MAEKVNHNINKIFLIFIALTSLNFYFIRGFGKITDALQLFGGLLTILLLIVFAVYGKNVASIKKNFKLFVIILLASLIPSMIVSAYVHDQSLIRAIYEQRDVYFYLSYFLLHKMQFDKKFLEKFILVFGILYCLFYVLQYVSYPVMLFDVFVMEDRNTLRIGLPGISYALLSYFYALQKYFQTKNIRFLFFCGVVLSISILLRGRQVIFMLAFVTIIYLLISRQIRNRIMVFVLAFFGLFSLFIAFQDVFMGLLQATESTKREGNENIRIIAAKYFLFEFFPNKWTYIFGNGNPSGLSPYGRAIDRIMEEQKYFLTDIGMIGVYVYYGAFFVIASFAIILKAFFLKIREGGLFIKYYFVMILQATLTGMGFVESNFIFMYCVMFYLLDLYHRDYYDIGLKYEYK